MTWDDDEGRQRLSIETPAGSFTHTVGTASRAIHASEPRFCCPTRRSCRDRCTSRGAVNQRPEWGTAASPGSQTRVPGTLGVRVACTSRGVLVTAVRTGATGVHTDGHSGSRLLWGSAVLGGSAWWTSLLLLQLVLHRCSAGHLLFMRGCYNTRAAPGSGVCREARDGACVRHAEEVRAEHTEAKQRVSSTGKVASGTCVEADAGQTGKCLTNHCDVWIGGGDFCSQCSQTTDYLINGKCTDTNTDSACENTPDSGVCTLCKSGYFLHRGGCYKYDTEPGNLVCKDTAASTNQGTCDACRPGYFRNPVTVLDKTKQSCIACNDTTGADNNVGIASCTECTAPATSGSSSSSQKATCTKCASPKYLKADGTCADSCTANTEFAKEDDVNGNICVSCGDQINGIADCKTCSTADTTLKCSACNGDKKPSTAGTACVTCTIANCASCNEENVCEACTGKKLNPLKDACLDSCPAGTYDNSICIPCHTSCAECNSSAEATSCTACYPGSVLSKGADNTKGICIKECTGAFMAHCKADGCTLDVGGSKYCDACEDGYAPIDGVCTAVTAGARDASGCNAKGGKCTACTGANYALLSGGCYDTQALPGMAVCTAANSGSCTTCANGQSANSGVCPSCPDGCANCKTNANQCETCYSGYYKSGSKCFKCTADSNEGSNSITGVPNCVSCAPPTTSGTVTCYVTQEPSVNPTDPSVNKGGLSSGAIAGISVAVIAVVGGLVGFLCWWFICRGKA